MDHKLRSPFTKRRYAKWVLFHKRLVSQQKQVLTLITSFILILIIQNEITSSTYFFSFTAVSLNMYNLSLCWGAFCPQQSTWYNQLSRRKVYRGSVSEVSVHVRWSYGGTAYHVRRHSGQQAKTRNWKRLGGSNDLFNIAFQWFSSFTRPHLLKGPLPPKTITGPANWTLGDTAGPIQQFPTLFLLRKN